MSNLIILGSARKDSHTRTLLETAFQSLPHEMVDLLDYNIATFDYDAEYPDSDQYLEVVQKMQAAANIIFATPVYWYAMSGMMKTFFDRFTDLITINKAAGRSLKGKNTFLFSVGADGEPPEGFEIPFRDTSSYLDMKYVEGIYLSSRGEDFESILASAQKFVNKIV